MAKDVFTVYSEDGRHGANCIINLECDSRGRYGYHKNPEFVAGLLFVIILSCIAIACMALHIAG